MRSGGPTMAHGEDVEWFGYTPGTDHVRHEYVSQYQLREDREEGGKEFDRWLNSMLAHAWRQGRYFGDGVDNPYEE